MTLFTILLIIHIAGGTISLLLGLYMLIAKKGDKRHVLIGNIFFYAMLTASLIALPIACMHPNYFLFIIGVFTAYLLITGKRYLRKKAPDDVKLLDWVLLITLLLFGIALTASGVYNLINNNSFGIVMMVFGLASIQFCWQDNKNFKGKSPFKNYWLTMHLQRMVGSYIASVTAFVVVNNTLLPAIAAWLLPTVILAPLIVIWTRRYGKPVTPITIENI